MKEYSKSVRKALHRLAGEAYDKELGEQLDLLLREFQRWKDKEIDPFDLSDAIHEFHQGPSRKLFCLYTRDKSDRLVTRAVGIGILKEEEVPAEFLDRMAKEIAFYKSVENSD